MRLRAQRGHSERGVRVVGDACVCQLCRVRQDISIIHMVVKSSDTNVSSCTRRKAEETEAEEAETGGAVCGTDRSR